MLYIFLIITIFLFAHTYVFNKNKNEIKSSKKASVFFCVFLIIGLCIRIFCALAFKGHSSDLTTFTAWSDMIYENGFSAFYKLDAFTDYPPGYMYILWIVGFITHTFNLSSAMQIMLIKTPAILSDLVTAIVLYSFFKKRNSGNYSLICALFLFNPVTILNSSLWGQVDSVMTLFLVLSVISLIEKKSCKAYILFALTVFLKPQGLIFCPLFLYYFYKHAMPCKKEILKHFSYISISLLTLISLSLPFGIKDVVAQYTETIASYPYASVNAFNYWSALSLNWAELTTPMTIIGMFFVAVITLSSFYLLKRTNENYFITAAFLSFSVFMFSVKMHERYAYSAVIMFFASYALILKQKGYLLYVLMTVSQFFNTAYVLFIYEKNPSLYYNSKTVIITSILNVIFFCYMVYLLFLKRAKKTANIERSQAKFKLQKIDYIIVAIIMCIYSIVAFSALGDLRAPESSYSFNKKIDFSLSFKTNVSKIKIFLASTPVDETHPLTITFYDNDDAEIETLIKRDIPVFYWEEIPADVNNVRKITFESKSKLLINEILMYKDTNETIIPENVNNFPQLFDEQYKVPIQQTYMNSTYFDEIYHARTAYEFINELPVYEWTHPPLGKFLISLGIKGFGMTPFGWRFAGTLFGVLMIPLLYITSIVLFKKRWVSIISAVLFSVDFMHFVQTRIATIDVYVTFFIMSMYLFMFIYASKSFYDSHIRKTLLPLLFSGISMGLAIACKWTGAYAAVGIAIIFFMTIYKRYTEYKYAKKYPDTTSNSISHQKIIECYKKYTTTTILSCVVFFIVIPLTIYLLSYIPYLRANNEGIIGIWQNQTDIFTYHWDTVVSSTHPFSSKWYSWPIVWKPIWYYSNSFYNGTKSGITAFGNPLVWWSGIVALVYCIYSALRYKDRSAIMLVIAYASNYLPWLFVERTTFIYHYFPSVPFLILMIGYSILKLYKEREWVKKTAIIYTIIAVIIFVIFYPVLSGMPIIPDYVYNFLRWLPEWILI